MRKERFSLITTIRNQLLATKYCPLKLKAYGTNCATSRLKQAKLFSTDEKDRLPPLLPSTGSSYDESGAKNLEPDSVTPPPREDVIDPLRNLDERIIGDAVEANSSHLHSPTNDKLPSPAGHSSLDPSKVVESIGSAVNATKQQAAHYTHEINRAYSEVEHDIMIRINESNQRRFRLVLLSTVLFLIWVVSVFGEKIRKMLSVQTAGLAKETLEDESLKVQTQELAMAVVQTVLNDKDVTAHAASFLREASVVPETQQALLALTLHVLQHPDSLREMTILVKRLIENLVADKETVSQIAGLLSDALEEPKLKAALVKLVGVLLQDPAVVRMATELTVKIIDALPVKEATNRLLMDSTQVVLADTDIISQSKDFVADVMGDDALQKEGGDAIWNSVTHALKPGAVRIIGLTLAVLSVAVGKVLLSPF